ncbi:MAG: hypothetical protein Fur0042_25840 [Cyanophyceae cyanobacterium]
MTTETRIGSVEMNLATLASLVTQQSMDWAQRFNQLANLTADNTRAIADLKTATEANAHAIADIHAAIDRLTQAMDARLADLDQKLEQYTDGLMGMIDQGIDTAIARRIEPLEASVTGLRLEVQRLIERLNP